MTVAGSAQRAIVARVGWFCGGASSRNGSADFLHECFEIDLTARRFLGMIEGCRETRREVSQSCLIIEFGNLDVRGELVDLVARSGRQEEFDRTISVIRTALSYEVSNDSVRQRGSRAFFKHSWRV